MNQYYTLFDPVDYNKQSIINLCDHYDQQKSWDDVYPGVKLKSKRRSLLDARRSGIDRDRLGRA